MEVLYNWYIKTMTGLTVCFHYLIVYLMLLSMQCSFSGIGDLGVKSKFPLPTVYDILAYSAGMFPIQKHVWGLYGLYIKN